MNVGETDAALAAGIYEPPAGEPEALEHPVGEAPSDVELPVAPGDAADPLAA